MTGDPGFSRVSRSISTAIPATGCRACSSMTKEFHAASRGRGSAVTMTVSSTSDTTPNRMSGPTMKTWLSIGSPPSTDIVRVCQPGSSRVGSTVSITPPRSATTSCVTPATVIETCANPTGTETKLRQPRTLAYTPVPAGLTGGTMSTRPRTRTQSTPP